MKPRNFEGRYVEGSTFMVFEEGGKSMEQYLDMLNLKKDDLVGKRIMDLGSGPEERFANEIEAAGIESDVVCVNPDYEHESFKTEVSDKSPNRERVAAIAQDLPFEDESFDLIVALESVSRYAAPRDSIDEAFSWATELFRVLKEEGEARLWPILELDEHTPENHDAHLDFVNYLTDLGAEVKLEEWQDKKHPGIKGHRMIIRKPKR